GTLGKLVGNTYFSKDGNEVAPAVASSPIDLSVGSETVFVECVELHTGRAELTEFSFSLWTGPLATWEDAGHAWEVGIRCGWEFVKFGVAGDSNLLRFTGFSDTNWTSSSHLLRGFSGLEAVKLDNEGRPGA